MSWQDLSLIEKQAIVNRDEAAIKKRLRANIMSIDAPSVKMGLLSVAWKEDGEGLEMSSFSKGILYKYGIKAERPKPVSKINPSTQTAEAADGRSPLCSSRVHKGDMISVRADAIRKTNAICTRVSRF